jgi:UDP-N-acetylmuramate: L-alanyl-gamma-D-glutamyl-meso-diaminopimelate ligase
MDPTKNMIPENSKTIHLIAACGTAMAALAVMLKRMGHRITGSDSNVYPPMSTYLRDHHITLFEGYEARNLDHRPNLVIVGNAVTRDNPESQQVRQQGLAYCSMPQAVNHFLCRDKKILIVVGTHGKTTTASLLAWLLADAGLDPSFIIGGIAKNFDNNHRLGAGDYVVLEGDEYDTAFFDKGPKFNHYRPHATIFTGVEFDHADIYRDLDHIRTAFRGFFSRLPAQSDLFVYDQTDDRAGLCANLDCRLHGYGDVPDSSWRLKTATISAPLTHFEVFKDQRPYGNFKTPLMGRHNLMNTLAAVAVADLVGLKPSQLDHAIAIFKGVRRRQEVRGVVNDISIIDDFAHHPTAVKETLEAVRPFCNNRLVAVFEPRTNTSMRCVFQQAYSQVFAPADLICIRAPSMLHKVPPEERFSSKQLVADLQEAGNAAHHFSDTQAIIDFLAPALRPGDMVLIMSNGGFDNIHDRLLARLGGSKATSAWQ